MIMLPLGSTSVTRTAMRVVIFSELLIWPPPSKLWEPPNFIAGSLPAFVRNPLAEGENRMVSRLASTLEDFEVLVLFCLEAVLFSCTRMLMMSPMARARLSANIERDDSSFHNEPGPAWAVIWARRNPETARRAKARRAGGMAN